ncbi:MAG: aldo/keto reductase [Ignavibacteriae bacterium]|nr:aldo/keto reductase [Ignavibacteriota bacterium]
MKNDISEKHVILNNNVKMPIFGLGVWQMNDGKEVENSVRYALEIGYRSIDTAALYGNEKGVGNAVISSGIKRDDIFITTKVWNSDQGYDKTLKAFSESMKKLQTDYVDLYLIHWPIAEKLQSTWKALEKLYDEKLVKAIGVSNFAINHLKELFKVSNTIPAINQFEYHPYLTQPELVKFCNENKIVVEAWAPIMKGKVNDISEVKKLSEKYNKTPAQIVLRWNLQKEIVSIPKSSRKERIFENAQIFDFELLPEDIKILDSLNKNYRLGPDPNEIDF